MGATASPIKLGGNLGPARGLASANLLFVLAQVNMVGPYATGGETLTLPEDVTRAELAGVVVMTAHDDTRNWVWNGSKSAPKLKAFDAFATEEGNGTAISTVVLQVLFIFQAG